MISIESKGDFTNTEKFLDRITGHKIYDSLAKYGQEGVVALSRATPQDTGETAHAWYYEIVVEDGTYSIIWGNGHVVDGRPVAILLQYGHGTRNGGYVYGRDYINPPLRPLFDRIAADVWKEVTSA